MRPSEIIRSIGTSINVLNQLKPQKQVNRTDRYDHMIAELDKLEAQFRQQSPNPPPVVESSSESLEEESPREGLTTEETIAYQNREIGKELLLLEKHLQQGCVIPDAEGTPTPCDCCSPKHTTTIEALSQETYGMTADPIYQEVAAWANEVAQRTTIPEIAKGVHDYGQDAMQARELRKKLMGTDKISALLTPEQLEGVKEKVKNAVEDL